MDNNVWLPGGGRDIRVNLAGSPAGAASPEIKVTLGAGPVHVSFPADTGTVYLLLDCSSSMVVYGKLGQAAERSVDFARQAQAKGYSVGLITFATEARYLCSPQADTSRLRGSLAGLEANGTTNMGRGIRLAMDSLAGHPGLRYMVIVTDGMPNSKVNALKLAAEAKKAGIGMITIGTDDADEEFLRMLASRTELASKVVHQQLGQAIADSAKMLPAPGSHQGLLTG